VASIVMLAIVAWQVFFRVAPLVGYADDSWTPSYMLYRGTLPVINLDVSDQYAMPYQDRRWLYEVPYHLARFLGNGDVTSYNVFLYTCYTLTAMLVYVIARLLLGAWSPWALVIALLKLVYPASFEVFSSAMLPSAGWGELMMAVAALCLVLLLRMRSPRIIRMALFALMLVAVPFPAGTYETTWLLLLLAAPLLVLAVALREGRGWRSLRGWAVAPVVVWYVGALASMAVVAGRVVFSPTMRYLVDSYASAREPSVWASRIALGSWTALSGVFDATSGHLLTWLLTQLGAERTILEYYGKWASATAFVPLAAVGVGVIAVVGWSRRRELDGGSFWLRFLLGALAGVLLLVAAVAPPTLSADPVFGTRSLQFTSYGVVILVVSLFIAAERLFRRPVVAASLAALLFVCWGFYLDSVATYYGEVGRQSRRFFFQLHELLPSMQEGTVVLIQHAPTSGDLHEHVTTMVLRAFTDTHTSSMLADSMVGLADAAPQPFVRVVACSNLNGPPDSAFERGYWAIQPCAVDLANPSTPAQDIARDRVIWLNWDLATQTLGLDKSRSAMGRIDANARSEFGNLLFPTQPPPEPLR
jgi:hypothetical protein